MCHILASKLFRFPQFFLCLILCKTKDGSHLLADVTGPSKGTTHNIPHLVVHKIFSKHCNIANSQGRSITPLPLVQSYNNYPGIHLGKCETGERLKLQSKHKDYLFFSEAFSWGGAYWKAQGNYTLLSVHLQLVADMLWLAHAVFIHLQLVHNFPRIPIRVGHTPFKR